MFHKSIYFPPFFISVNINAIHFKQVNASFSRSTLNQSDSSQSSCRREPERTNVTLLSAENDTKDNFAHIRSRMLWSTQNELQCAKRVGQKLHTATEQLPRH